MIDWMTGIDDRAVVHPDAKIGNDVSIGPFSTVGPNVTLGDGCWVGPHVLIDGHTQIGRENKIHAFSTIGFAPQDLKYANEPTRVVIGDRNIFREYCQVHRGTQGGGGLTQIGNDGFFMVNTHIAHDCFLGDHVLFANAGTLAGHVDVGDYATIGAYSGVHQFCRVGAYAYIGGYSVVTRDALPFCLTVGNRAHCYGINHIGLKRSGFSRDVTRSLDRAVRALFRNELTREQALELLESEWSEVPEVMQLTDFVRKSKRGVVPLKSGQDE